LAPAPVLAPAIYIAWAPTPQALDPQPYFTAVERFSAFQNFSNGFTWEIGLRKEFS